MNDTKIRIHWIIPLVILVLLLWNGWVCWAQWGKLVFIGAVALPFVIVFFMSIFKVSLPADFLVEEAKWAKLPNTMFIPGWRLFQADFLERSKKGPTGSSVSLNALLVLFLIMTGMAFFSTTETLIKVGYVPYDWYTWANKHLWLWLFLVNGGVYVFLTILVNLLTAHTFSLGYQIDSAKNLMNLTRFFGIDIPHEDYEPGSNEDVERSRFWMVFSQYLENIYGHKVWSGRGISTLIDTIRAKKDTLGTSQWFLLEFAADVLDHHIAEEKLCIRMSYDEPEEYSHFLARTMRYCTRNIIWIVDRKDFVDLIFPVVVREVLLSLAQNHLRDTTDDNDKTLCVSLSEMVKKHHMNQTYRFAADIPGFCTICRDSAKPCRTGAKGATCGISIHADKEEAWLPILKDFEKWAVEKLGALSRDAVVSLCDDDSIWNFCTNRRTDCLGFPHMRSYYEHDVPKSRIIELPSHPEGALGGYTPPNINKDSFTRIADRLLCIIKGNRDKDRSAILDLISNKDLKEKVGILADEFVPNSIADPDARCRIFLSSWKLFGHLSNSETQQRIVGFAEVERLQSGSVSTYLKGLDKEAPTFDIGVYDNCVMVNSRDSGPDQTRPVVWTMVDGTSIQKTMSTFDPRSTLTSEDKEKVFLLSRFILYLQECLANDE